MEFNLVYFKILFTLTIHVNYREWIWDEGWSRLMTEGDDVATPCGGGALQKLQQTIIRILEEKWRFN